MFSMAVLAAMVSISMEMIARVAAALWATEGVGLLFGQDFNNGITSQAMQQGGMGLILTTLIISAPPMAAMFFQGTLGTFMAYSQIGGSPAAQPGPQGQPPGSYTPQQPQHAAASDVGSSAASRPASVNAAPVVDTGSRGNAR